MDPSPTPAGTALSALLRRLLVQGIQLIGGYGWTWVDWYELAEVSPTVLHHALQGRIIDEAACLRLAACLGWVLTVDPSSPGGCHATFRLPRERLGRAPMPSLACARCLRRGTLSHEQIGMDVLLACSGCGEHMPLGPASAQDWL